VSRTKPDRRDQALAAAHTSRAWMHRRRFGWPGTEPPEGRNPVLRWGSIGLALVGLLVVAVGQTEIAAALTLLSLAFGAPRAWTLANDRISCAIWGLSAVLLIIGEIVYAAGGSAARASLDSKSAGAGAVLVGLSLIPALVGYFRRWGTAGNVGYLDLQVRRGDPTARAAVRARAEREGYKPPPDDD
jgi:hypothetical protein